MSITIERESENHLRLVVKKQGEIWPLEPDAQVIANLIDMNGKTVFQSWESLKPDEPGANWKKGEVVWVVDTLPLADKFAHLDEVLVVLQGRFGRNVFQARITQPFAMERSELFLRDVAVREMRDDQLLVASSGAMREVKMTDDYIWQKLRAAESELGHKLRILLRPYQIFPRQPTEAEIAELQGKPWMVETPYDYQPDMYDRDKWGYFITRQRPIIDVQRLRFQMPSAGNQYFDMPLDWLRLDKKYGHVRVLPTTNASLVTASVLGFTALTWQSIIPNMLNLTYTAGIENAQRDYPELIDAIKKMAVVKIITDLFLPQSGSISADGLSESMSTDVAKYQDQVDHIINGHDGNGGLMAMFNGIRAIVI